MTARDIHMIHTEPHILLGPASFIHHTLVLSTHTHTHTHKPSFLFLLADFLLTPSPFRLLLWDFLFHNCYY